MKATRLLKLRPALPLAAVAAVAGVATAWLTAPRPEGSGISAVQGSASSSENVHVAFSAKPGNASLSGALEEQRRLVQRLRAATPEEIVRMLEETVGVSDSTRRGLLQDLLLEQYAWLDGEGGAAFFGNFERGSLLGHFLRAWARVSPEAALAGALPEGGIWTRTDASMEMLTELAENPALFTRVALTLAETADVDSFQATGFERLARVDPARALELAERLIKPGQRTGAFASIAKERARREPEAAYAWAKALTDPAERQAALRGALFSWAETDPRGVAEKMKELKNVDAFENRIPSEEIARRVARGWALTDPMGAAVWARENAGVNFRSLLREEILPARDNWSVTEMVELLKAGNLIMMPREADSRNPYVRMSVASSSNGYETLRFGPYALESSVGENSMESSSWRVADPAKAVAELEKMPSDTARHELLSEAVNQWARADRAAVLEKAATVADPVIKAAFINALINDPARFREPEDLRQVLNLLDGPQERTGAEAVERHFWERFSAEDPQRAEELLRQGELTGAGRNATIQALARSRAAGDPAGAMEWVMSQPEEVRILASAEAMGVWARSDAYEASAWLAAQPEGPVRENAIRSFVGVLEHSSPEDAAPWAEVIGDDQWRESALKNMIKNLSRRSTARAERLVDSLERVTPEFREKLRGIISGNVN